MNEPEENEAYHVEADNAVFRVVNNLGEVTLSCGDEANAAQYTALLNAAYRRGYKQGYREGRSKVPKSTPKL